MNQRGVALITALLVMAVAVIAATAMVAAANVEIRRSINVLDSERAWWYADGVESWIKTILMRDRKDSKEDYPGEAWAQPIEYLPIENDKGGGFMRGQLVDLQGRFNLNNLADPNPQNQAKYAQQFARLLGCIGGLDGYPPQDLVNAISDWMDADDEVRFPGGAEDLNYLSLKPPYRAANRPLTSAGELLAVHGVDQKLFEALRGNVTALPVSTQINVNTAPLAVLCSLSAGAATADWASFMEDRIKNPVTSFPDSRLPKDLDNSLVTTSSQFFELQAEVFVGNGRVALYSVFKRDQGTPVVLAHSTATD